MIDFINVLLYDWFALLYSSALYVGNLTLGSEASYWFVGMPRARRIGTTVTGRATPTPNRKQAIAGIGWRWTKPRNHPLGMEPWRIPTQPTIVDRTPISWPSHRTILSVLFYFPRKFLCYIKGKWRRKHRRESKFNVIGWQLYSEPSSRTRDRLDVTLLASKASVWCLIIPDYRSIGQSYLFRWHKQDDLFSRYVTFKAVRSVERLPMLMFTRAYCCTDSHVVLPTCAFEGRRSMKRGNRSSYLFPLFYCATFIATNVRQTRVKEERTSKAHNLTWFFVFVP